MLMRMNTIDISKKKLRELVEFNNMPSPIAYKFWDKEDKTMYRVSSISFDDKGIPKCIHLEHGDTDILEWYGEDTLIPSTCLFDKNSDEIFMGDIVMCDFLDSVYKDRVVFWDNGFRVIGCTTDEFKIYCEQFVSKIGNIWEDEHLYKIYTEKLNDILK